MLHTENGGGSPRCWRAQNTAPSGAPSRFSAGRRHSLRLFLQEVRGRTARPLQGNGSFRLRGNLCGDWRPFRMTDRPSLTGPGRLRRVRFHGSCMARGRWGRGAGQPPRTKNRTGLRKEPDPAYSSKASLDVPLESTLSPNFHKSSHSFIFSLFYCYFY